MKVTAKEFIDNPKKSITLIGMSGAGKTHISGQLEGWGWDNYSCDYEIGSKYLKDELSCLDGFTGNDISALSVYLGKLGKPEYGGFLLDKFKSRQVAYYDAEVLSLRAMDTGVDENFIHDSTGSFCEVDDDELISKIGEKTLFVYLKTGEEAEKEVLKRASDYPKPLFFPPKFLHEKLEQFLSVFELSGVEEIEPDEFSRWVFPLLFNARKPKYQRLADLYGVAIPSSEFKLLESSDEFIEIIAKHLGG